MSTHQEQAEQIARKLGSECVEQDGPYAEDGWSWLQDEATDLIRAALDAAARTALEQAENELKLTTSYGFTRSELEIRNQRTTEIKVWLRARAASLGEQTRTK